MNESLQKILEIDSRHNDLLDRLDDLDAKILSVLEEWTNRIPAEPVAGSTVPVVETVAT